MAWQSGVLILIGLGLWVLSFFAPVRPEPAPAPVVAAPAAPAVPAPTEPMGELARKPEEAVEIGEPPQETPESSQEEDPTEEPPPAEAEGEDEQPV